MPSPSHDFLFDSDFGFGNESVFTDVHDDEGTSLPPVLGFFLYLAGPPFTLLDGQNLALL